MYRQGLGDCFLLSFDPEGDARHVLIDCGSLGATTTGVRLAEVVRDIRGTTKDKLDLLIATHEHWDHLSGFAGQKAEFDQIQVKRVWLAWTENPADPLAQSLAKNKQDIGSALAGAAQLLTSAGSAPSSVAMGEDVQGLIGLFNETVLGAGSFSESVNQAMDYVRTKQGAAVEFLEPGEPFREESWLPGFRIYVLGPPRDRAALFDIGGHGSSELYGVLNGLRAAAEFGNSADSFATYSIGESIKRTLFDRQMPFDPRFREERSSKLVKASFGESYLDPAQAWRKVEENWLGIMWVLALQLDSVTNNTSLVLAIERIADGRVLLFPADAQQGSWLSWHQPAIAWKVPDSAAKTRDVTAEDLLKRTVFYKVGHHASHNATAQGKGLELMANEGELTAFIPVDRAVALGRHPAGSWKMPARKLYRRLLEKCGGRVVRSDLGWAADSERAADQEVEAEFDELATVGEWAQWAEAQQEFETAGRVKCELKQLYVDYLLK